jgi:hypothetical protein
MMFHKLILIPLLLVCFGLAPLTQAVVPPPDGGYPGANTAEGTDALLSLTTGIWNTALGFEALKFDTVGRTNTATGVRALGSNISGSFNTANGVNAMNMNLDGWFNSAVGAYALATNTMGDGNTAVGYTSLWKNTNDYSTAAGYAALYNNTTGFANTAVGAFALFSNTTSGNSSNAFGYRALFSQTTGLYNNGFGWNALGSNVSGTNNSAIGDGAGQVVTGSSNTCLGANTCGNTTTANNVVCIGSGASGENFSNRAYIPNVGQFTQNVGGDVEWVTVRITDGKLGHSASSRRYKEDINPMGDASEVIYKLKPVTYRFKQTDVDPKKGPQPQNLDYGLIAEDVAEIDPKLAIRDGNGQIESVRYMAIYNMMLNEFLKEHRTVEELKKEIAALTTTVKEQAAQIQKVSAQLETGKPATKVVVNTP